MFCIPIRQSTHRNMCFTQSSCNWNWLNLLFSLRFAIGILIVNTTCSMASRFVLLVKVLLLHLTLFTSLRCTNKQSTLLAFLFFSHNNLTFYLVLGQFRQVSVSLILRFYSRILIRFSCHIKRKKPKKNANSHLL